MRFEQPGFLLFLVALPALVLVARWSRSGLERGRSIVGTVVRAVLVVAVVFSLADAHWVSRSYRTATIFLLDHSYSIPQDIQRKSIDWITKQIQKLPKDDVAGVIVFGEDAMIETLPDTSPQFTGPHTVVGRAATDLGAAIRLALGVFPQGYQRRIVLLSDGNENRGNALPEADSASAQGVVIDVLPLYYEYAKEVWMEALHVPSEILPNEPYDLTAVVNSQSEGEGTLWIYRNRELLSRQAVHLNKGKNVFTVKQKSTGPGNFAYEAVIEAPGDTIGSNNSAHAFASARGEARIAIVADEDVDAETLARALREEGLSPMKFSSGDLAATRFEVAAFDAIVLANVEALRVGQAGMQAVESAVHDAGVGFIMVGGERSFGPGGYRGTPMEELLPVTMEQPQRRVLPNGALCLILHTCEIPEGNFWAKQIGKAALNVLGPRDYMGVVIFGQTPDGQYGAGWHFPMTQVRDRSALRAKVDNAQPGDMPDFEATYKLAHQGLTNSNVNAASKHIVVISDADPSGPTQATVDAIIKDRITVSTIAINPHGSSDVERMRRVAHHAGGRFYDVQDAGKLPQIFIKEAATIQRSMIIEGDIPPAVSGVCEALKGISAKEIPVLHGYTLTSPKPLSRTSMVMPVEKGEGESAPPSRDALLVEWTYGLGRTMAFTSDAKPRWARDWVAWPNFRKFWSQAVRSVLRTVPRAPYQVQTEIEGGKGKVIVDAVDEKGKFVHTLQFAGSVTSPEGKKSQLAFRQVGPGRYEAQFDANAVGVYTVTGSYEGAHGEKGYLSQGVPLSYAAEYRDLKTNLGLLEQIRMRTEGRRLSADDAVYAPLPHSSGISMPMWPFLLMAVLVLFPIDIFIRRVAVDWGELAVKVWGGLRPRRAERKAPEVPVPLQALMKKKQEVRAEQLTPVSGPVDLGELSGASPSAPRQGPAAPPEKKAPPPPAAPPPPPEQSAYLARLLEAKKKSQKKE